MKLNHIAVFSKNIEKTCAFYKNMFPELIVKKSKNTEDPIAFYINDSFWIAIFSDNKKNCFEHFALEVELEAFEKLKARVKDLSLFEKEYVHEFPYQARSFYIETPDGYDIEIFTKK